MGPSVIWWSGVSSCPLTEVLSLAETLPKAEDGDVYMMRLILHDWHDMDSVAILSSVRQAMGSAKATLLIVEVGSTGTRNCALESLNFSQNSLRFLMCRT